MVGEAINAYSNNTHNEKDIKENTKTENAMDK